MYLFWGFWLSLKNPLEYQENVLVHLIHMQERHNAILFEPWGEKKHSKGNKKNVNWLRKQSGGKAF